MPARPRLAVNECRPVLQPVGCSCGAFSHPAAVTMVDHAIVELFVDLEIYSPLHDAIREAQRHNKAALWLRNIKLPVSTHLVSAPDQGVLYFNQIFLQPRREGQHVAAVPFLARCFVVCVQQIFPRVYTFQKGRLFCFFDSRHSFHVFIKGPRVTLLETAVPLRPPRRRIAAALHPHKAGTASLRGFPVAPSSSPASCASVHLWPCRPGNASLLPLCSCKALARRT